MDTTKKIMTVAALYNALMDATTPAERDHHCSDLYVKATPETTRIIRQYEYRRQIATFRDQTDPQRALWYDIPFAYLPYWENHQV